MCEAILVWNLHGQASPDWQERVDVATGVVRMPELRAIDPAALSQAQGQTWIAGAVLVNHGYEPQHLGVVRVKGKIGDVWFELVGKTADVIPGTLYGGWLIQRIDVDGAADSLTPEQFGCDHA